MMDEGRRSSEPDIENHSSIVASICREMVGIHARLYGRRPTKVRTSYSDDLVVTVLEDSFTKAEEMLVGAGKLRQVRNQRQAFQDELEPLFRQAVEVSTGRPVRSFLGQVNAEGIIALVFVLRAPAGDETADDRGDEGMMAG